MSELHRYKRVKAVLMKDLEQHTKHNIGAPHRWVIVDKFTEDEVEKVTYTKHDGARKPYDVTIGHVCRKNYALLARIANDPRPMV